MIYITGLEQYGEFIKEASKTTICSVDTETTGLDYLSCDLILLQVKLNDLIFVFDCRKLDHKYLVHAASILETKLCCGQNFKFDVQVIYNQTGILLTNIYDTFTAEILTINQEGINRYPSLKDLVQKYCNVTLDKEVRNSFIDNPNVEITQEILFYSAEDVNYLLRIKEAQEKILEEQGQTEVLKLENRTLPVIAMMEYGGILLDKSGWQEVIDITNTEREEKQKEVFDDIMDKIMSRGYKNAAEACDALLIKDAIKSKRDRAIAESITDLSFVTDFIKNNFKITSHAQMKNLLTNYYGIPIKDTNEKTINKFSKEYAIIDKLIAFREKEKQLTSFGSNFLNIIHPKDNRIHTSYNTLGAVSGRMSSDSPNLANIPKTNLIRNKFISREGYDFIGADYGQEEYRFIGLFDHKIADFYRSGENDIHLLTGSFLSGKPIDQVNSDDRKLGKTMNFAVGFGTTAWGLHKNFNLPIEKAEEYLDNFYNRIYTELRDAKKAIGKFAWEKGYSRTFLGRKRFFNHPSLFSDGNEFEKFYARTEREAFNHIPQGSSADVLKMSLCDCFYNNPYGDNWQMLLQVYDEIDSEADKGISKKVEQFIKEVMIENLQKYLKDIPATVDSYRAPFWKKD